MTDRSWIITTAAGTGEPGFAGDGGPALEAQLNGPFDVGFDPSGNLYFSDTFNHRLRRIDRRTGIITTIAGNGTAGYAGDGGPAVAAAFNEPYGIAVDRDGNIFAADRHNHCVRRIDGASGVVTTFAGNGAAGYSGDGGPAAQAGLVEPNGLGFDPPQQRLFIADVADHRVRVVDLGTGTIATFAGTGEAAHRGDGGPAAAAGVFGARAAKVAPDGTVYILERQGSTLRAVDPGDRGHHHPRRHRCARLWRRWRAAASGGIRRAQGIHPRPRRRHSDRRYRKPRDPPHRCQDRHRRDDRRRAKRGRGRWRARQSLPGSAGRTAAWSAPTARSTSATPKTTASANCRARGDSLRWSRAIGERRIDRLRTVIPERANWSKFGRRPTDEPGAQHWMGAICRGPLSQPPPADGRAGRRAHGRDRGPDRRGVRRHGGGRADQPDAVP